MFRAKPAAPESLPYDPDFVRKHLMRILRLVAAAEFMPWPPTEAQSWIERFPKIARNSLPPEEADQMVETFEAEIARLRQVPTPARTP